MVMQAREPNAVAPPSGRLQCWVESLLLRFGMPAAIWAVSRLLTLSIPAAVRGSPEQRFFYWLIAGAIVEWLFVAVLWFVLRRRKLSISSFGVWRLGLGRHGSWLSSSRSSQLRAISGSFLACTSPSPTHSSRMDFIFLPLLQ